VASRHSEERWLADDRRAPFATLNSAAQDYAEYALVASRRCSGPRQLDRRVAWVPLLASGTLPATLPDGRPLTRRWRLLYGTPALPAVQLPGYGFATIRVSAGLS
jgi:hypothetical protein